MARNCMYCEEQKCCCKNIERKNKMTYNLWGFWIRELLKITELKF